MAECWPLFERAIKELGLKKPDISHALLIFLEDALLGITEGRSKLLEVLDVVASVNMQIPEQGEILNVGSAHRPLKRRKKASELPE